MHRQLLPLLPLAFSLFCLTACNNNQPAEKIGNASATASASGASSVAAANWLRVKDKEYGDSGVVMALDARITDSTLNPSVMWTQTSGPAATLINPTQLNANVVLPFVDAPTALTFRVTATANGKTLTGTQILTALPLVANAQISNPVLSVSDEFVTLTLTEPVAANTVFSVLVSGGTAVEGIDFAKLPTTVTAVAGNQIHIPITLLANNRTQDVYTKITLKAPNSAAITLTVVAPAETAMGSQVSSQASSVQSSVVSSSVQSSVISSEAAAESSIAVFSNSSLSTSSEGISSSLARPESSSVAASSSEAAVSSSSTGDSSSQSENPASSDNVISSSAPSESSSVSSLSNSSSSSNRSSLGDINWQESTLNNGVIYADVPQALQGLVDDISVTLNGNAIAVEKVQGEQGIEAVGFAVSDFAQSVNQLVLTYLQADLSEIQQSQYIFKETNNKTGASTLGVMTFADSVVSYVAGSNVIAPYHDPLGTLGQPNKADSTQPTPALGDQGVLVVGFSAPVVLTGNPLKDVWVFEVGDLKEAVTVDVSEDGMTWFTAGTLSGGVAGVDVDALTSAPTAIQFVRITDLLPAESGSPYAGADIDAVGLIRPLGEWRDGSASSIDHASSVSSVGSSLSSSLSSTSIASLASLSSESLSSLMTTSSIAANTSSSLSTQSSSIEIVASSSAPAIVVKDLSFVGQVKANDGDALQFLLSVASNTLAVSIDALINQDIVDVSFNSVEINLITIPTNQFINGENTLTLAVTNNVGEVKIVETAIYWEGVDDVNFIASQDLSAPQIVSDNANTLYLNSFNKNDVYFYRDKNNLVIRAVSGIYAITLNDWFETTVLSFEKVKFKDGSDFYLSSLDNIEIVRDQLLVEAQAVDVATLSALGIHASKLSSGIFLLSAADTSVPIIFSGLNQASTLKTNVSPISLIDLLHYSVQGATAIYSASQPFNVAIAGGGDFHTGNGVIGDIRWNESAEAQFYIYYAPFKWQGSFYDNNWVLDRDASFYIYNNNYDGVPLIPNGDAPIAMSSRLYSGITNNIAQYMGYGEGYILSVSLDKPEAVVDTGGEWRFAHVFEVPKTPYEFDPYSENVTLMLDFENDDDNTIFADASTANAELTAINQAHRTTQTFAKSKVASFDGDFDSLTVKESPLPPALGTTFTVETWVYLNQLEPINNSLNKSHGLWSENCDGGACEQGVTVNSLGTLAILRGGNGQLTGTGSWSNFASQAGVINAGEWTHIAHSFDGLTHRLFVNGHQVITFDDAKGWYHPGEPFRIGEVLVPSYSEYRLDLNGYLDNFRVTRGVVRYSQDFTPPLNPAVDAAPN